MKHPIILAIVVLFALAGFAASIGWMIFDEGCLGCYLNRRADPHYERMTTASNHSPLLMILPGLCPLIGLLPAIVFASLSSRRAMR